MSIYLGFDSSTQSLSAMAIDVDRGEVVVDEAVNFGSDLPHYDSPNGFLSHEDPSIKHSDPLMWVEALDLLLKRLKEAGAPLNQIKAISGAGQQHGSVYLKKDLESAGEFDSERTLHEQVGPLLSRKSSPIWMDSSTSEQCRQIAEAVGGEAEVTRISGSRAIERFTGPQIRKFSQEEPERYAETTQICLVSSFMASLLTGRTCPIDTGDGAGMNLMDLKSLAFSPALLEATAPELGRRLTGPVPSETQVGELSGYFVRKYGFAVGTPVYAFTGDNPSSLIGMGASAPGTAVVSLGTSDTVFAAMRHPRTDPRGFGHVFGNPAGGFMSLICFANGSLARERIKDELSMSWDDFARAIREETSPGNSGNFMLPYFVPEMTPKVLTPRVERLGTEEFESGKDRAALVRAVVEFQALTMQRHSDWIGETPTDLLVTGGASKNPGIRQVLADVFQATIRTLKVGNSSALGAALRAAHAGGSLSWEELTEKFAAPSPDVIEPGPGTGSTYGALRKRLANRLDSIAG